MLLRLRAHNRPPGRDGFAGDTAHIVVLGKIDDENQNPNRCQARPNPAARPDQFQPEFIGTTKERRNKDGKETLFLGCLVVQFIHNRATDGVKLRRGGLMAGK